MTRRFTRHTMIWQPPELTPIIDIVFILLIFFMVTASVLQQTVPIDLPTGTSGRVASTESAVVISIDADSQIWVDQVLVERGQLVAYLTQVLTPESTVVLNGDQSISYGLFVSITDQLNQLGVSSISLAVDPSPMGVNAHQSGVPNQ